MRSRLPFVLLLGVALTSCSTVRHEQIVCYEMTVERHVSGTIEIEDTGFHFEMPSACEILRPIHIDDVPSNYRFPWIRNDSLRFQFYEAERSGTLDQALAKHVKRVRDSREGYRVLRKSRFTTVSGTTGLCAIIAERIYQTHERQHVRFFFPTPDGSILGIPVCYTKWTKDWQQTAKQIVGQGLRRTQPARKEGDVLNAHTTSVQSTPIRADGAAGRD
jgi:hypothetical protein